MLHDRLLMSARLKRLGLSDNDWVVTSAAWRSLPGVSLPQVRPFFISAKNTVPAWGTSDIKLYLLSHARGLLHSHCSIFDWGSTLRSSSAWQGLDLTRERKRLLRLIAVPLQGHIPYGRVHVQMQRSASRLLPGSLFLSAGRGPFHSCRASGGLLRSTLSRFCSMVVANLSVPQSAFPCKLLVAMNCNNLCPFLKNLPVS